MIDKIYPHSNRITTIDQSNDFKYGNNKNPSNQEPNANTFTQKTVKFSVLQIVNCVEKRRTMSTR